MPEQSIGEQAVALAEAARNGVLDARTTDLTRLILDVPGTDVHRVLLALAFIAGNLSLRADEDTREAIYDGVIRHYAQ